MRAISMEIRERVMQAVDEGVLTQKQIGHLFGVTVRWVRKLIQRRRETGSIESSPHAGGPKPVFTPEVDEQLKAFVAQHPDATLQEIKLGCGLSVSLAAICKALKRLRLTRKKKVTHASEQDRPDVQADRRRWKRRVRRIDVMRLIFVDETGVTTQMHRTYGRAPIGERVVDSIPEKHYHSSTLLGAMQHNGSLQALVYDGGTDISAMLSFIERQLVPILKPGDVVVWDNLRTHQSAAVIQAVEKTGARVMPLPAYSPELNPIESLWSKMKTYLRSAAARTKEDLMDALRKALESITDADVEHWFQHSGY